MRLMAAMHVAPLAALAALAPSFTFRRAPACLSCQLSQRSAPLVLFMNPQPSPPPNPPPASGRIYANASPLMSTPDSPSGQSNTSSDASVPSVPGSKPTGNASPPAASRAAPPPAVAPSSPAAQKEDGPGRVPKEDFQEDFEAGLEYGRGIVSKFTQPRIDDPGLPYADTLVVLSGVLTLSFVVLLFDLPRPGWLAPLAGVPAWRALPYVIPSLLHGTQLALCWLLGALAASAFEAGAFTGSLREALSRTWRGGSFAMGVLLLSTQLATYVTFAAEDLEPILGVSTEIDYRLTRIADEVIVDVVVQAVGLTAFRIFRWWDARPRR